MSVGSSNVLLQKQNQQFRLRNEGWTQKIHIKEKMLKIAGILLTGMSSAIVSMLPSYPCFGRDFCVADGESKQQTMRIVQMIKPYFLSAYSEGKKKDQKVRSIHGVEYIVERANHGLAHGLRQGALAKDIFDLLLHYPISDSSGIIGWAHRKNREDPQWIHKIEIVACFQRSGRQSECSSASNLELYKKYEMQDTINFRNETQYLSLFSDTCEQRIFEEAILWSNLGTLDENKLEDLKYLRRILHAAHTLDLRRMCGFDGKRIQQDAIDQLFGGAVPLEETSLKYILWNRSGDYLQATGDRDLVSKRNYQDRFFIQTKNPTAMVEAICEIRQNRLW